MCKCRSHGTFPLFGLQSSHLNICYYHQDLHRRPLRPGSRPRFCSDRRALLLIRAWHLPRRPGIGRALQRHPFSGLVSAQFGTVTRLPVHPASPVLLTKNGPLGALDSVARLNRAAAPSYLFKVCSHSNPSQKIKVGRRCSPLRDPANQLPCALRVYSPVDSHTCQTPWSVFQDGPNGEPAGRRQERAGAEARQTARAAIHNRDDDVSTGISTAWAWAAAVICIGPHPEPIGRPANAAPFSAIRNARITGGQIPPKHLVAPDQSGGGRGLGLRCVTPRQTCPRPSGFGRNLRSKTRWFTGFCNSHQVSHFATFFIDARAEISVAESHF
ncbi:Protein TAR1 [Senna tora]|uniref:Protein TAR1 n=1 Tax=Senna tora TaxID=362788 RepID=A0A834SC60_9FABA|nr:Protein TAR1 [Senna tora]